MTADESGTFGRFTIVKPGNNTKYSRASRERGGDETRGRELDQMRAYRATPNGREVRRASVRNRYAAEHGTARNDAEFVGIDGEGGQRECTLCSCPQWQAASPDVSECGCTHDREKHRHVYLLLRAGHGPTGRVLENEDGSPLTSYQCLDFLADLPPDKLYVVFAGNYDVAMMLTDLPERKLWRLHNRSARTPHGYKEVDGKPDFCTVCSGAEGISMHRPAKVPGLIQWVDIPGFEIDCIKSKFFKVRRVEPGEDGSKPVKSTAVEISDVWTFFQSSFVSTLETWKIGTAAERESISGGKDQRQDFGVMTDEIRRYNELEMLLLDKLMSKFREECKKLGLMPGKWQGPGELAATMLRNYREPQKKDVRYWTDATFTDHGFSAARANTEVLFSLPPGTSARPRERTAAEWFHAHADSTFYGGRFEASAVGEIPGPIYNFDINSAYPFALTHIPCLVHGEWTYSKTGPTSDVYFAQGTFRAIEPAAFYGFPVRNRAGGISFPGAGNGWYWSSEIKASRHQKFRGTEFWSYHRACECKPFEWVPEKYQQRIAMGKDVRGLTLKLALNSLYGKYAQRIGSAPFNNFVTGSFVTAFTRAQLQNFVHSLPACREGHCGDDVHMLATDGIFAGAVPEGFTQTKDLGGWDMKPNPDGIFIVKPGIYFGTAVGKDGERAKPKTRGLPINLTLFHEPDFRRAFKTVHRTGNAQAESVRINIPTFYGLGVTLQRRKPELLGQWEIKEREETFAWTPKRRREPIRHATHLQTLPPTGRVSDVNMPYDRELSRIMEGRAVESGDPTEMPDWMPRMGPGSAL